MKLHKVKSKNAVSYYVIESFRKPNGGALLLVWLKN